MTATATITFERLREVLDYDPDMGIFTWRITVGRRRGAGKAAGCLKTACGGYVYIGIDDIEYRAHRLAWFWMTEQWPKEEIDHRNGDRANNRFDNLREASRKENAANSRKSSRNTSGVKGIYWIAKSGKWRARFRMKGGQRHLGCFDTFEEAVAARRQAAQKLHGAFVNHG